MTPASPQRVSSLASGTTSAAQTHQQLLPSERSVFEPNAINVIPSRATLTVDLRDPDEGRLQTAEDELDQSWPSSIGMRASISRRASRSLSAREFRRNNRDDDRGICITDGLEMPSDHVWRRSRRPDDGASCADPNDFVPSIGGVSHNPKEFTPEKELVVGVDVLLNFTVELAGE